MGIRFKSSTWRSPLRLIDNLLPLQSPATVSLPRTPGRALQWFARAGWLNRDPAPQARPQAPAPVRNLGAQTCGVRVLRASGPAGGRRHDMRMVISGRIDDVCAELDRLAAQEQSSLVRPM